MNPRTPPTQRHGLMSPPASSTTSQQSHTSSSEYVHGFVPISPPSSTTPSQQRTSNNRSVHGFSQTSRSSTTTPSQPQMWPARYYDGPEVLPPPPMVSSPELVPSRQPTQWDDPEYLEWQREKHLKRLGGERQEQQMPRRTETPEQLYSQPQHPSERQRYSPPQPDPLQRSQTAHQPYSQQQQNSRQNHDSPPEPSPLHRSWTEQQPYQQTASPQPMQQQQQQRRSTVQQYIPPQQDDYWYQPQQHQTPLHHPFPHSNTPLTVLRRSPLRSETGYSSRAETIDDYDQRIPRGFGHQQVTYIVQQQPRRGHKFGKITVQDDARVLMGNGIAADSTGDEKDHEYGDVVAQKTANVLQGDMPVEDVMRFFGRA